MPFESKSRARMRRYKSSKCDWPTFLSRSASPFVPTDLQLLIHRLTDRRSDCASDQSCAAGSTSCRCAQSIFLVVGVQGLMRFS